jgi:hypothetical protein
VFSSGFWANNEAAMEFEAIGTKLGRLTVRDVRTALDADFFTGSMVNVAVVGSAQQGAAIARIGLIWVRAGRGDHRMLQCPRCNSGCNQLHVVNSQLVCARCGKRRTRQQLEKRRRDFRRLGGLEEDRVLRLLATKPDSPTVLSHARLLARNLAQSDTARVRALDRKVTTVLERISDGHPCSATATGTPE